MWTPFSLLSPETWILLLTFLTLIRYYVHRKWQYLRDRNIPHDPPKFSRLGHTLNLMSDETCFEYENKMKKKHGLIWGAYRMTQPAITIHDPEILRQIFSKEFSSFSVRQRALSKIFGKHLNSGLTSIEGRQWKRIRSSMSPTFSNSKIKQMMYIMERCVKNASDALDGKIQSADGEFSAKTLFSRLSLDVVCSAAFSIEVNSQDEAVGQPEVSEQCKKLFAISPVNPLFILCVLCPPFERVVEYFDWSIFGKAQLKYFEELALSVINRRNQTQDDQNERMDLLRSMLNSEASKDGSILDQEGKGMTRSEIIGNSMLMILAGYENTSNLMTCMAYNLAQNPDIQSELQKEIDDVEMIDYDSVINLKFLDMCLNETLRLQTPVLRNTRICDEETMIKGFTIPKGVDVHIPMFALAHDPDYWEDPYQFNPERMRDMSQIDPMMFQPFGAGPRNCIGTRFALIEVKLSMAKLLRRFTFKTTQDTPNPPLKLTSGLGVRPAVDFNLRATLRT